MGAAVGERSRNWLRHDKRHTQRSNNGHKRNPKKNKKIRAIKTEQNDRKGAQHYAIESPGLRTSCIHNYIAYHII